MTRRVVSPGWDIGRLMGPQSDTWEKRSGPGTKSRGPLIRLSSVRSSEKKKGAFSEYVGMYM